MKRKILVVDDEPSIVELLSYNLKKDGYEVLKAYNAEETMEYADNDEDIDLFIIDVMLPDVDGFDLTRKLRAHEKHQNKPIIFLTAKTEEFDKILGLELGADDYITKPFSVREVLVRIKAIFRRIQRSLEQKAEKPKRIAVKDLEIDLERYEILVRGEAKNLTPLEFELLRFLAENEG
ncbi:MAG: response regulator transcription factor, partial [Thermotogota bacterium]